MFFQMLKLNKYCLGVELAPARQVIKKVEKGSSVGLHTVSQFMPQRLQNVIKKGHARKNKRPLEISCKNKVLIKSYSA